MGLLDMLFNGKGKEGNQESRETQVYAPVDGQTVPIGEVKDETFSQKILGDGIAILPESGEFCSPADGKLESVFPTGHAYAVTTEDGAQILVHIGFDTVELKGKYFTVYGKNGEKVKRGDRIVSVDLEGIRHAGYDLTTPVVILNSAEYAEVRKTEGKVRSGKQILTLVK